MYFIDILLLLDNICCPHTLLLNHLAHSLCTHEKDYLEMFSGPEDGMQLSL